MKKSFFYFSSLRMEIPDKNWASPESWGFVDRC